MNLLFFTRFLKRGVNHALDQERHSPQAADINKSLTFFFGRFHAIGLVLVIALAAFLRIGYIQHPHLPGGDEPSWMSVAAQLAQGQGFTTRWLEHLFLQPQTLPRPDDFRFPGFTLILTIAFGLFGISYKTALYAQLFIGLFSLLALYYLIKKLFNKDCALLTVFFSAISLYQIHLGSRVYAETLYALVMYMLLYWIFVFSRTRLSHWLILSFLLAITYYIRPNVILIYPFFVIYLLFSVSHQNLPRRTIFICLGFLLILLLPWWLRNWTIFGNPFHVAAGGGFFVKEYADRFHPTFFAYLAKYGWCHLISRPFAGAVCFFQQIIQFEHGFIIAFFILAPFSLLRLIKFSGGFLALSLVFVQILSSFWISYTDWSGPRYVYFSWPLFYALGSNTLLQLLRRLKSRHLRWAALAFSSLLLLFPIINPHRYYYRLYYVYSKPPSPNIKELVAFLKNNLNQDELYLAVAEVAVLNFLTDRNCISEPELNRDQTIIKEAIRFKVKFIVLSNDKDPWFKKIIQKNAAGGQPAKLNLFWQGESWKAYSILPMEPHI